MEENYPMNDSSLNISVQTFKRVDLVSVTGRIDSNSAPELDSTLKEILDNGRYQIVMDLNQVNYMSSAGLRTLVATLRECKKHSGDVRLSPPSERVAEVLELAGLDPMFQIFDDKLTAVGSF
jgi:anti-sigma B factor antagonist